MLDLHSIEIKNLLERSSMPKKQFDIDSDSNLTTYSNNNSHTLQRSDSSSTLHRPHSELSLIHQRYQTLEHDYHVLLAQTKEKNHLFHKQKEELEVLRLQHCKDQKEIQRLRSLIDIVQKSGITTLKPSKNAVSASRIVSRDKNCLSVPKERVSPIMVKNAPGIKDLALQKQGAGLRKIGGSRCEGKGQFGRYKFVPSMPLQ